MAGAFDILEFYKSFTINFSPQTSEIVNFLLISLTIAAISVFVGYFYTSISRRDVIGLNLSKYNKSEHPELSKLYAILLYLAEYLIVVPVLLILWFSALSVIILVIASESSSSHIVIVVGATVCAIRILAYHNHEVAKDLAKLFPFIALSIFLLTPQNLSFEIILTQLNSVPSLFKSILSFFVLILIVEVTLRLIYTSYDFLRSERAIYSERRR